MLRCDACDREYADRWRCECGAPLRFAERPLPAADDPASADLDPRDGLWTYDAFLPVGDDPRDRVSLGEGFTPLVDADDQVPGGPASPGTGSDVDRDDPDRDDPDRDGADPPWDARFKLEYVHPTGSFKDRGATTTLTRAREVGADRVLEDSSGNAGAAIATYAARAGIPAEIYVPADAKRSKLAAIRRSGADLVPVEGDRQAVTDACVAAVRRGEGWYASHAWNPAFVAGTATVALEIAHQSDWSAPDAVVVPLGHGTMFLGAALGFEALHAAGWTDRLPRLLGAQATGAAPIAAALHGTDVPEEPNDLADGIQIRSPVQRSRILDAIDRFDGDAIAVTRDDVAATLERLHRAGFYVEPTSAVAPAALRAYRDRGEIAPDDDVVVALTGSGLKG